VIGPDFALLLAAAQRGEEDSFAALWRDANPVLLRYLAVLAPGAADDVAAETWVTVVRGLASFQGDEQAWRGWLLTTARRRAIDEGRARGRRAVPVEDVPEGRPAPDAADVALEGLSTERALALVATLPPLQAEVVLLRVVAGLDVAEVARILGRRPGAIRVAAHRALARLRAELPEPAQAEV
jgi:RNA polymerase sigma-70 factor (ECF subfamily)